MGEHGKLPWRVEVSRGGSMGGHYLIRSANGYVGRLYESSVEDSEYIVQACNNYHRLIEALQCALEWIDAVPTDMVATLPAMPGFDRDDVDELLTNVKGVSNDPT